MINYGTSFCRNENKYLVSFDELPILVAELSKHLPSDPHSKGGEAYQVNTLYFDNERKDMIARSISHPLYKEKIRVRSYGGENPSFFLEFKNKFESDVYKNRIILSKSEADDLIMRNIAPKANGDYKRDRFLELFALEETRRGPIVPSCLVQYRRIAFLSSPENEYTRVTIDTDLRYRENDFDINKLGGSLLLDEKKAVLEIKVERALPLYLVSILNSIGATRTAFSKYGTAFLVENGVGKSRYAEAPNRQMVAAANLV